MCKIDLIMRVADFMFDIFSDVSSDYEAIVYRMGILLEHAKEKLMKPLPIAVLTRTRSDYIVRK